MTLIQNSNITVMISHMDTSIRFYTETLGLKLKTRYGDYWAEIEAPGLTIGLHPTSNPVTKGDNFQIGFRVENLRQAIVALEEKGVRFEQLDDQKISIAFFTDPDGNLLYLGQPG